MWASGVTYVDPSKFVLPQCLRGVGRFPGVILASKNTKGRLNHFHFHLRRERGAKRSRETRIGRGGQKETLTFFLLYLTRLCSSLLPSPTRIRKPSFFRNPPQKKRKKGRMTTHVRRAPRFSEAARSEALLPLIVVVVFVALALLPSAWAQNPVGQQCNTFQPCPFGLICRNTKGWSTCFTPSMFGLCTCEM